MQGALIYQNLQEAYPVANISECEFEIIELICQRKSNAEIAEATFLSINTVKYRLKQIFARQEIKSRIELINKMHKLYCWANCPHYHLLKKHVYL